MLLIPTTKSALFYFDKQLMINSHVKFNLTRVFPRESLSSVKIMLLLLRKSVTSPSVFLTTRLCTPYCVLVLALNVRVTSTVPPVKAA